MPTALFVHGMFLTPRSWDGWIEYFLDRGYECIAPAWPMHAGEPSSLRYHAPPGLGALSFQAVLDAMAQAAEPCEDLVLIGHSAGGLVVQQLLARGIGRHGVAIASVAPNRMLAFDWSFLRNAAVIANPLAGDTIHRLSPHEFHVNFANTLSEASAEAAWEAHVVPESRNVLRDCLGDPGRIDLGRPHVPMLFVGAQKDAIVPPELCAHNARAYTDPDSLCDYAEFRGRSHFLCTEPGWDEVAATTINWLDEQRRAEEGASLETWRIEAARETASRNDAEASTRRRRSTRKSS